MRPQGGCELDHKTEMKHEFSLFRALIGKFYRLYINSKIVLLGVH